MHYPNLVDLLDEEEALRLLQTRLVLLSWSRKRLAKEVGVSPQFISMVLKGKKPPTGKLLKWLGLRAVKGFLPI